MTIEAPRILEFALIGRSNFSGPDILASFRLSIRSKRTTLVFDKIVLRFLPFQYPTGTPFFNSWSDASLINSSYSSSMMSTLPGYGHGLLFPGNHCTLRGKVIPTLAPLRNPGQPALAKSLD